MDTQFQNLKTGIADAKAELKALAVTSESADTLFKESSGLVREYGEAWSYAKAPVLSFQEALDGLALPDIPSVSVPVDLELPGVDSPLQKLIEDANRITEVATEVTDVGKSFADLRGEVGATELTIADLDTEFGNLLDTVVDVKDTSTGFFEDLLLLSDNAPTNSGRLIFRTGFCGWSVW